MTPQATKEIRQPHIRYHVVIVDYGKWNSTTKLIKQLGKQTLPPDSIDVIDNSPQANELLKNGFEKTLKSTFNYQHFPENIGYTKACNIGVRQSSDYILFLNPDIEFISEDMMHCLLRHAASNAIEGPIGVAQQNPDGTYEPVARRYPDIRSIISRRVPAFSRIFASAGRRYIESYENGHDPAAADQSVDWLQSSFLLVPRSTWTKLGGFDETFFVFMADVEYGMRCNANRKAPTLSRQFVVRADGLRSSRGGLTSIYRSKILRIHLRDAMRFFWQQIKGVVKKT